MSGPMALAAYRRIKTQTRRPFARQPRHSAHWDSALQVALIQDKTGWKLDSERCPHGSVGDLVYVRETWAAHWMYNDVAAKDARSTLPDDNQWFAADGDAPGTHGCPVTQRGKWRPSIHMPKWAARTWGRITDVRVQRVQDITEGDASAEGFASREQFLEAWDALYPETMNPWVWAITWEKVTRP